jgi:hypothetical protein
VIGYNRFALQQLMFPPPEERPHFEKREKWAPSEQSIRIRSKKCNHGASLKTVPQPYWLQLLGPQFNVVP